MTKRLFKRRCKELKRKCKAWLKKLVTQIKKKLHWVKLTALLILATSFSLSVDHLHSAYLLDKVGSNSVYIQSPAGAKIQGSATGFEVVTPSGKVYTLTNAHVCELQKDGNVLVQEKRYSNRLIPKRVIEIYEENDLCLVEGLEGYEGLSLASSWNVGDLNYAIGYPMGEAMNLSSGFIKEQANVKIIETEIDAADCKGPHQHMEKFPTFLGNLDFCVTIRRAIQTNIPIFPGNSGSPMINAFGHVTGVVFASNNETHWGDSVPLEDVKEFLKAY